jgi:hypothetical protein
MTMSSWRDRILEEFTPKVARLTLVADPDGLLLEEGILEGIRERGFELIPFEDRVAFRFAYESAFRSRWDRGEHTDLVVVLRSQAGNLGELPYDLLQAGRSLSFSLGDIFPNLSYPVVAALDRGDLDALHSAQQRHAPGPLGENATKEFILRHVFQIAPELIKRPSDLLRALLRRHYRGLRVPKELDERFVALLRENPAFDEWPLEILARDREAFFAFLQERWPVFLDRQAGETARRVHEAGESRVPVIAGPVDLPFDHDDVRVYIDNLFAEGVLRSVPHDFADSLSKTWVGIGVRTASNEDGRRRLGVLAENLRTSLPAEDARHPEWFRFARGWAEFSVLLNGRSDSVAGDESRLFHDVQSQVDARFSGWMSKRFAGLVNLPPEPPVMTHHIPRFLARRMDGERGAKVALLLVDGLSMDQWFVARRVLEARGRGLLFRDDAVFAWVPSITSVSRQAAFAGKAPVFFPNSIRTTDRESALWSQFWTDAGLAANQAVYAKGLGDGDLAPLAELLERPKVRVAGLVVDKVDRIMHGMEMGTAGMQNQVAQWAGQPYFGDLLDLLLDRGFTVFLTSDHGNVEASGCGRPDEGVVADLRGERVRVYPDGSLRRAAKRRFPDAIEWPSVGLPDEYNVLLAPSRKAFVPESHRTVSHGGISIEEIIVPFVRIERKRA